MFVGVLVGAFENYGQCREVIAQLIKVKVDRQRISVIGCYPCSACMGSFAETERLFDLSTTGTGVIDALLGWLSGAGVLSIPSIGSFVVSGPLKSSFAAGQADGDQTITDTLTKFNIPEYDAMVYEALLTDHKVVIFVNVDSSEQRSKVLSILSQFNAIMLTPGNTRYGRSASKLA